MKRLIFLAVVLVGCAKGTGDALPLDQQVAQMRVSAFPLNKCQLVWTDQATGLQWYQCIVKVIPNIETITCTEFVLAGVQHTMDCPN